MKNQYKMYRGDTKNLTVTIEDEDGQPVDVSSAASIIYGIFEVKLHTAKVLKTLEDMTVVENVVTLTLAPEDTEELAGVYDHEMEIRDVVGNVFTVLQAQMIILEDLIRPAEEPEEEPE